VISPLLDIAPCPWQPPEIALAGLIFTSANAIYCAGAALNAWLDLPVFVVGEATAQAARRAGFLDVRHPENVQNAQSLFAHLAQLDFTKPLLHLVGRDQIYVPVAPTLQVETCVVYAAELIAHFTPEAEAALRAGQIDAVLLYSPRTAQHFAHLYDALGLARSQIIIGALSPAIAQAAGDGWADVAVAIHPENELLFTAVHLACARRAG